MLRTMLLALVSALLITTSEPVTFDIQPAHATAYCLTGTTASGHPTRPNSCAAKREWLGKTIFVYQRLPDNSMGELIGIYDVLDTGGTPGLNNGSVIDIWQPDMEHCKEFMERVYEDGCQGRIYIYVTEVKG